MQRNKQMDGYRIADSVLKAIKEPVEKAFKEEFAAYVKSEDLNEIFSSYEFVNLTENNFNTIERLVLSEQPVEVFRLSC